jgi:poly(3-hydroxybutyrate) depolymerase
MEAMTRRPAALLLLAAAFAGRAAAPRPAAADEPPRPTLAEDLAAAVDLPTPKARAARAASLATRPDLTVASLLEAMRAFGTFSKVEPGVHVETVALQVGDKVEATEVHWYASPRYDPAKPTPLLVYLHGMGGNGGEAFHLWQAWADRLGMLLLAPSEAGPNDGYRFTDRERWAVLAALRWARRRLNVDENRIHLAGASRGGHMTWDLALRFPDIWAAIVPMIGAPRLTNAPGQNNLRYLENLVDAPIRDLQGSKDNAHAVGNLRMAFQKLAAWKARDARLIEFPERAHDFDFTAVDWGRFLPSAVRDPAPPRVVRRASKPGEGRSSFVEILKTGSTVTEAVTPHLPPEWATMGEAAQRAFVAEAAEKATARLAVRRTEVGRFEATAEGVSKARLLLAEGMFDPAKAVVLVWNGSESKRTVRPSKQVLLAEFVERFDRTFLPVAEVAAP